MPNVGWATRVSVIAAVFAALLAWLARVGVVDPKLRLLGVVLLAYAMGQAHFDSGMALGTYLDLWFYLLAALAIQHLAATAAEPRPEVRIAVHLGEVRFAAGADGRVLVLPLGDALALPERMLGHAGAADVLVSPRIARQVAQACVLEPRPLKLGPRAEDDVTAYAVVAARSRPATSTLADLPAGTFVGRERELAMLEDALRSAEAVASPELALAAIRQLLVSRNIKGPELVIENGSGLSRVERASAGTIAAVLHAAWRSSVMPEFVSSLPVVAADGTMKKRLLSAGIAGHAHIKTGLLQDVRSIAGYVLDKNGRRHLVVMIINHPRASSEGEPALNAMLEAVYEGSIAPAAARGRPPSGGSARP